MKKPVSLLILLFLIITVNSSAQSTNSNKTSATSTETLGSEAYIKHQKKGHFFITPFYEFTRFKNLKLKSISSIKETPAGNIAESFTTEDINMYNDYFGTEYQNSMTGIKIGYQVLDGFGISAYTGVNHFNFKSWLSTDNAEESNTTYPALTLGLAVDYQKMIIDKLIVLTKLSYNYCKTNSISKDNTSGNGILSTSITAHYWETNVALAYQLGKFYPFIGAGFTEQFVNTVDAETELYTDANDVETNINAEYDSHFIGNAFYGFAGLEYHISHQVTLFGRSSFINPLRANIGLRIIL